MKQRPGGQQGGRERAGGVASVMANEVVPSRPYPCKQPRKQTAGKKNLLHDNGELTKQGRMTAKIWEKAIQRDKPGLWGCSPRTICQFQKTAGSVTVNLGEVGGQESPRLLWPHGWGPPQATR